LGAPSFTGFVKGGGFLECVTSKYNQHVAIFKPSAPIKTSMASSRRQNNASELDYAAHNRKDAHERILSVLSLLDVTGIPLYIAWFIWRGQFVSPRSWFGFPIWLVASFLLHGDNPKTLGMRADNLWPATKQAAIVYGIFAIGLLLTGIALRQGSLLPPNYRSFGRMWVYFAFCLLQQIALNSLLMNRLVSLINRRWLASIVAGTIFAALHWPNPVLVPLTFIGGTAMAWMFARVRNILPLAAGQALLGSLAWWAFPIAWHHMLRVGPGYYWPILH